ncbi:MAG: triose-phosphate isomerase [Candidatus Margulisiibacteriota bacterium]|jgi:triosephosphate isomerase
MRKPIIAGNWKMNKTKDEAITLAKDIKNSFFSDTDIDIVLCPPFTALSDISEVLKDSLIKLGAQNMFYEKSGAFTGEISASMLKTIGAEYVIIGHSERRTYFNETNESINKKIIAALNEWLIPIICVGETLEQRELEETFDIINYQLKEGLKDLSSFVIDKNKEIVIAYEPVWAIGTGKVASPLQAEEVHAYIRKTLAEIFNPEKADMIRIQYGGSVTPDNIESLMVKENIDGALVGGASLKASFFSELIELTRTIEKN